MHEVEVTILGSGTCAATSHRSMAGYHLYMAGQRLLLDIGDGVLRRLLEAGLPYEELDAILISHHHIDHIGDLLPYLWALRYSPEVHREKPLTLIGPPATKELYDRLAAAHGEWMHELPFPLGIEEWESREGQLGKIQIKTLPMYHSVPVNGYRLEASGKTLVYTGDTGYHPNVVDLAREADLLLIECSFLDGKDIDTHMTPMTVGQVAREAGVKHVVVSHLYPECDRGPLEEQLRRHLPCPFTVATDLLRLPVPPRRSS